MEGKINVGPDINAREVKRSQKKRKNKKKDKKYIGRNILTEGGMM